MLNDPSDHEHDLPSKIINIMQIELSDKITGPLINTVVHVNIWDVLEPFAGYHLSS